jgi:hypothetical protein
MCALALVAFAALLEACRAETSPLSDLRADQIRSIDISDHNNRRVQISDLKGIEFFLAKTKSLRAKKDFKVNPEFEITVNMLDGSGLHLRMGKDCIGPNVPASAGVTRWYFEDPELYDFVSRKLGESVSS